MIEISLDEHNAFYSCGHDANIFDDEFAIVLYVKYEIVAIAPILGSSFNEKHDCNDVTCCSENPKKHLPPNVSLLIMESYLRMLRAFMIAMMFNKLKNLLLLRVLMKLLL